MFEPIMRLAGYVPAAVKPDLGKRSNGWPKVAHEHLDKHPTCAACGLPIWDSLKKKFVKDGSVHHVRPFHIFRHLELDPDNLLTLCESANHNCHLWIGHLGFFKSWNETAREDAAYFLEKIKNRPRTA